MIRCHRCEGEMITTEKTDLPFKIDSHKIVIVRDVPAYICDSCGEILLPDAVVAEIDRVLDRLGSTGTELEIIKYAA